MCLSILCVQAIAASHCGYILQSQDGEAGEAAATDVSRPQPKGRPQTAYTRVRGAPAPPSDAAEADAAIPAPETPDQNTSAGDAGAAGASKKLPSEPADTPVIKHLEDWFPRVFASHAEPIVVGMKGGPEADWSQFDKVHGVLLDGLIGTVFYPVTTPEGQLVCSYGEPCFKADNNYTYRCLQDGWYLSDAPFENVELAAKQDRHNKCYVSIGFTPVSHSQWLIT